MANHHDLTTFIWQIADLLRGPYRPPQYERVMLPMTVLPDQRKHGSRLTIVFSGSPLFTGGAGSGESDIRKWIIENDWLEAIVALPEQMFYNTGIGTYVWIVTNRKEKHRKGKIQLVDARDVWTAGGSEDNKRSLGDKRRHMTSRSTTGTLSGCRLSNY